LPTSHPSTLVPPEGSVSPRAHDAVKSSGTGVSSKDRIIIPCNHDRAEVRIGAKALTLTHCDKVFWSKRKITKGQLLQYYADIAPVLLPHIANRAMVMKRYPNGADGEFFFQKRAPQPHPGWLAICEILHPSMNRVGFPVINDVADLLWVVNLGCIDLNPWYARCDDVDRPDYMHFDLDPTPGADFDLVRQAALLVHQALDGLKMRNYAKTTGSRGIHIYVPIVRGPDQKTVWTIAKALAKDLATREPGMLTAEYKVARRPKARVLVDYNQNAWGRTLASVYSVRPLPLATVSAPVTWEEVADGITIEDFRLENMRERLRAVGDLFQPILSPRGRFHLESLV